MAQTRRSNGGSFKSETQGQRKMVHDALDTCAQQRKSMRKGDVRYKLAETTGVTLFEAYTTWELDSGVFWTTKHPEEYEAKTRRPSSLRISTKNKETRGKRWLTHSCSNPSKS